MRSGPVPCGCERSVAEMTQADGRSGVPAGSAEVSQGSPQKVTAGGLLVTRLRPGDVRQRGALSVVPLFADTTGGPWYDTLGEAVEKRRCQVGEVNEGGSVPSLYVRNSGDTRVLILDGEELRGAKQNRVLNTTILVDRQSDLTVPVSCTEAGRWSYESVHFAAAEYVAERRVRSRLRQSVETSVRAGRGFISDQGAVWDEVSMLHARQGTHSETGAMRGAFESKKAALQGYLDAVAPVDGQQGLLVLLGERVVGLDFLSIPEKYARLHDKLVRSYALEALGVDEAGDGDEAGKAPDAAVVREAAEAFLRRLGGLDGQRFKSPGLGWDVRFSGAGLVGSLLTYRGRPIHGAFFDVDGEPADARDPGSASRGRSGRMTGARERARNCRGSEGRDREGGR